LPWASSKPIRGKPISANCPARSRDQQSAAAPGLADSAGFQAAAKTSSLSTSRAGPEALPSVRPGCWLLGISMYWPKFSTMNRRELSSLKDRHQQVGHQSTQPSRPPGHGQPEGMLSPHTHPEGDSHQAETRVSSRISGRATAARPPTNQALRCSPSITGKRQGMWQEIGEVPQVGPIHRIGGVGSCRHEGRQGRDPQAGCCVQAMRAPARRR